MEAVFIWTDFPLKMGENRPRCPDPQLSGQRVRGLPPLAGIPRLPTLRPVFHSVHSWVPSFAWCRFARQHPRRGVRPDRLCETVRPLYALAVGVFDLDTRAAAGFSWTSPAASKAECAMQPAVARAIIENPQQPASLPIRGSRLPV